MTDENVPELHTTHELLVDELTTEDHVPAIHAEHLAALGVDHVPALQERHDSDPGIE